MTYCGRKRIEDGNQWRMDALPGAEKARRDFNGPEKVH
jgi:hypothetical protein